MSALESVAASLQQLRQQDDADAVFLLAFHGAQYNGWQRQGVDCVKSLEGTLLKAFQRIGASCTDHGAATPAGRTLTVATTSRTDAGVSAQQLLCRVGNVLPSLLPAADVLRDAHSTDAADSSSRRGGSSGSSSSSSSSSNIAPWRDARLAASIQAALNSALPADVRVVRLRLCRPSQIQLKYAIRGKAYSYYLRCSSSSSSSSAARSVPSAAIPSLHTVTQAVGRGGMGGAPLDVAAMATALAAVSGRHNFSAFSRARRVSQKPKANPRWNKLNKHDGTSYGASEAAAVAAAAADSGRGGTESAEAVAAEPAAKRARVDASAGASAAATAPAATSAGDRVRRIDHASLSYIPLHDSSSGSGGSGSRSTDAGASASASASGSVGGSDATGYFALIGTPMPLAAGTVIPPSPDAAQLSALDLTQPHLLRVRLVGPGFLRHQVRRLVGALVAIGQGRQPASFIADTLAAADAGSGGGGFADQYRTIHGRGLWLEETLLPDAFWEDPDWCNNPNPRYAAEQGIPAASWVPLKPLDTGDDADEEGGDSSDAVSDA